MLIYLSRATYLLFPSNLNLVPTVGLFFRLVNPDDVTHDLLVAYGYSSDTLGFIIEKITGQTLEEYWSALVLLTLVIQYSSHI